MANFDLQTHLSVDAGPQRRAGRDGVSGPAVARPRPLRVGDRLRFTPFDQDFACLMTQERAVMTARRGGTETGA